MAPGMLDPRCMGPVPKDRAGAVWRKTGVCWPTEW